MSIFTYQWGQYGNLLQTGIFSAVNLSCWTIAFQNDKSATVSLFAYIALVYAFLADLVLYNAKFNGMEVAGAAIITFFNIFTIVWQHKHPEIEEKKE
jgi:drug/metabolite transporter (DMT)-like permease